MRGARLEGLEWLLGLEELKVLEGLEGLKRLEQQTPPIQSGGLEVLEGLEGLEQQTSPTQGVPPTQLGGFFRPSWRGWRGGSNLEGLERLKCPRWRCRRRSADGSCVQG